MIGTRADGREKADADEREQFVMRARPVIFSSVMPGDYTGAGVSAIWPVIREAKRPRTTRRPAAGMALAHGSGGPTDDTRRRRWPRPGQ